MQWGEAPLWEEQVRKCVLYPRALKVANLTYSWFSKKKGGQTQALSRNRTLPTRLLPLINSQHELGILQTPLRMSKEMVRRDMNSEQPPPHACAGTNKMPVCGVQHRARIMRGCPEAPPSAKNADKVSQEGQ